MKKASPSPGKGLPGADDHEGEVAISLGAVEVKPTLGELTPWPWTARRVRKGEWYELHPRRWTMFSRSAAPATRGDL